MESLKMVFILWVKFFIGVLVVTKAIHYFYPGMDITNYYTTAIGTLIVSVLIHLLNTRKKLD